MYYRVHYIYTHKQRGTGNGRIRTDWSYTKMLLVTRNSINKGFRRNKVYFLGPPLPTNSCPWFINMLNVVTYIILYVFTRVVHTRPRRSVFCIREILMRYNISRTYHSEYGVNPRPQSFCIWTIVCNFQFKRIN